MPVMRAFAVLAVLPDLPTELRFADGKVSGSGGCNRISGGYTLTGGNVNFGPIAGTKMPCGEKQIAQEAKLLSVLNGKVSMGYTVNGDLILTNASGQRATFKQIF